MRSTLYFLELMVRNFMSFGNNLTSIDLSEPGTISIEGQNLDIGGSNGAGKTTLINALCYALYNKPFDMISLQRLINSTNSTKNTMMEVRLRFERSGDEYEIVRTRGEQYTIALFKNGEDITPGKGVTECDKLIVSIIGISYEMFTKTIIFSGNSPAFLNLPIAQQRQQIEELFNITLLSEKAGKLRELIKQAESDLKIQEAVVKQQEVALELHQKHVAEAGERVTRWQRDRNKEIGDIESTLLAVDQVDFELEQLLHDEKTALIQEGTHLAAKLTPAKKDKQQLEREVEKLMGEQLHLEDAKCPYCSQNFADAALKIAAVSEQIDTKGKRLIQLEADVHALVETELERKARLTEVETSIKHSNFNQLLKARENVTLLRTKLDGLRTAQNPHTEALERLQTETQQRVDTDKIDTLKKRLEHQAFLLKLLTSKDSFLRHRIINKTIPFLNDRINDYTLRLGLPHVVKFDADMSCTVAEFGRELDFGNLSAGEKKRVNTALAFAFRDVLHRLHAKTNILLIDELDGQLDGSGIDAVVKILKDKSRDEELGIYVISHHPNIAGRLDRTTYIRKEHGFSNIFLD